MSDGGLVGTCHCGRVRITLSREPDSVTQCNCSLCTKSGFQGIYFASDEVKIEGELDSYVRADSNPAYIAQQRCRHCGIITHWTPLTDPPHERIGINARLFEPGTFDGLPVKQVDGRSWPA
ncbi:MAG: GFA family protein [Pseudomonadota bacterium]